jgi:hypothetical protein
MKAKHYLGIIAMLVLSTSPSGAGSFHHDYEFEYSSGRR